MTTARRSAGAAFGVLGWLVAVSGCQAPRSAHMPGPAAAAHATLEPHDSTSTWIDALCYGGDPAAVGADRAITLLDKSFFRIGYDEDRANPAWVCYAIGPATDLTAYPTKRFLKDTDTAAGVVHDDCTNSGFDRGHMAPRFAISSRHGKPGNDATFIMSNVCPQFHDLNDGHWGDLEEWIAGAKRGSRFLPGWADEYQRAWVIVGPIFEGDRPTLPDTAVQVPSGFYGIVVDEHEGEPRVLAFIMPHVDAREPELVPFLRTVREIETVTGLDFLSGLPDAVENVVETSQATALWPLPEAPN
jgi:endonuclease G